MQTTNIRTAKKANGNLSNPQVVLKVQMEDYDTGIIYRYTRSERDISLSRKIRP